MRYDIAKQLVERPRVGGGKHKMRSARRKGNNPNKWEHLPDKEAYKRPHQDGWMQKTQTEYFAPLKGFLKKNVGRPWNKVNSEVRALLSPNSAVQKHVLDHLYRDFVELTPMWVNGVPHDHDMGYDGKPSELRTGNFYVDQNGLLREYKRKVKKKTNKPNLSKAINDREDYRRINGVWYRVKYEHLHPGLTMYDIILKKSFSNSLLSPWGLRELLDCHGPAKHAGLNTVNSCRIAVSKKQISKKEIKQAGLV